MMATIISTLISVFLAVVNVAFGSKIFVYFSNYGKANKTIKKLNKHP